MKDWGGNSKTTYVTLGASNHTDKEREENDFYATHPIAAEWLMKIETLDKNIWECSAGRGDLSEEFLRGGYNVRSTDLIDRGYGEGGVDFLKQTEIWNGDIVTNPPYKYAQEFIEHALELVPDGHKVCMFLKLTFLESQRRRKMFEKYPPKTIWVSSSRIQCGKNGIFEPSAVAYAWYVWEKGYNGETIVRWFN